jgi:hypothetical protein
MISCSVHSATYTVTMKFQTLSTFQSFRLQGNTVYVCVLYTCGDFALLLGPCFHCVVMYTTHLCCYCVVLTSILSKGLFCSEISLKNFYYTL